MRVLLFITLLTLQGCQTTNPFQSGFAAQIMACKEACESRSIERFDSCICKSYEETKK